VGLIHPSALLGILENQATSLIIGQPPLFNLIQGPEAAKAGKVIAQTAISYAR
jgi:hypothetical protein